MKTQQTVHRGMYIGVTFLALSFNAFAEPTSFSLPERKLPIAVSPPACVCTKTSDASFAIANCQCGALQCVVVGAEGKGSSSITCVK